MANNKRASGAFPRASTVVAIHTHEVTWSLAKRACRQLQQCGDARASRKTMVSDAEDAAEEKANENKCAFREGATKKETEHDRVEWAQWCWHNVRTSAECDHLTECVLAAPMQKGSAFVLSGAAAWPMLGFPRLSMDHRAHENYVIQCWWSIRASAKIGYFCLTSTYVVMVFCLPFLGACLCFKDTKIVNSCEEHWSRKH